MTLLPPNCATCRDCIPAYLFLRSVLHAITRASIHILRIDPREYANMGPRFPAQNKLMKVCSFSLGVFLMLLPFVSNAAGAAPPAIESRTITQDEVKVFDKFYHKNYPAEGDPTANFLIMRTSPKQKWEMKAKVMLQAVQGYKNLCKQNIVSFFYDPRLGWQEEGAHPLEHQVWLDPAKACHQATPHVVLQTPLPDVDLIDYLHHADAVLKQAFILLRGNTNCSMVSLKDLKLTAIGTGAYKNEEMVDFQYLSSSLVPVTLTVRRLGADFTTWNVDCPLTR